MKQCEDEENDFDRTHYRVIIVQPIETKHDNQRYDDTETGGDCIGKKSVLS